LRRLSHPQIAPTQRHPPGHRRRPVAPRPARKPTGAPKNSTGSR